MKLYKNIIHLTRKHLFNITLVPMQTEQYILANTGIATSVFDEPIKTPTETRGDKTSCVATIRSYDRHCVRQLRDVHI